MLLICLKSGTLWPKNVRKFAFFKTCLWLEALSILLTKWLGMKGGSLPPHTRGVSPGGESAETVTNGAAGSAHSGWDAGTLSPLRAQRTLWDWVTTNPLRFRKKKRGRKQCKTGVSQTVTFSLYMVLLNGGEVWEQGNQEGGFLLAEPVTQVSVETVAVPPSQAAEGRHLPGPCRAARTLYAGTCTKSAQVTSCLIYLRSC